MSNNTRRVSKVEEARLQKALISKFSFFFCDVFFYSTVYICVKCFFAKSHFMVRRRHTHTRQSVGHRHTHTNWRFYTPLGGRMPSPWGLTAVAFSLCKISLILPREVGGWASKEKDTPLRWSYSGRSNKGPPGVCAAQNYTTGRLGANLIYIQLKKLIDKKTVPVHVRRLSLFLERRGRIWVIHEVFFLFLSI